MSLPYNFFKIYMLVGRVIRGFFAFFLAIGSESVCLQGMAWKFFCQLPERRDFATIRLGRMTLEHETLAIWVGAVRGFL